MGAFGDLFASILGGGAKKPSVPALKPLDLSTEQGKAAAGNIAVTPQAGQLSNLTADQIQALIEKNFPGFSGVAGDIAKNISEEVQGKIPTDVIGEVQRDTAASSLMGGYGGTPMAYNKEARNLGLTSLDIMNKGLSSAESWLSASEKLMAPAEHAFTSMFVTPGEQASFDINERDSQWNTRWLQNQVAAMADPKKTAIGEAIGAPLDAVTSCIGGSSMNRPPQPTPQGGPGGGGNVNFSDVTGPNYDPWGGMTSQDLWSGAADVLGVGSGAGLGMTDIGAATALIGV